jgi:hypothetical protein
LTLPQGAEWLGTWIAAFPNVQGHATLFVIGSYLVVERKKHPRRQVAQTANG